MNIQNEILNFDEASGTILVRYFTSDFPEGFAYNIDLPIVDGQYPSEEELQELVRVYEPRGQLERIVAVKTATVPENLRSKVAVIDNAPVIDKAALIRATRNEMLSASDYTQLSDVGLTAEEKEAWKVYRQALRDITEQSGFPDTVVFPISPSDEPR